MEQFRTNRQSSRAFLGILLTALIMCGCSFGDSASGPINASNFIYGRVYLVEEDIESVHTQGGVLVTVSTPTWKATATSNADGEWRVDNPARGSLNVKSAFVSTDTVRKNVYYDGEGPVYVENIMLYAWSQKILVQEATITTSTIVTKQAHSWDPPTDSAIRITVRGTTNSRSSDVWFLWGVYGSPSSPCSESHIPGESSYPDQTWHFSLTKQIPYAEFRALFGPSVAGKKVYVHARCGVQYKSMPNYEDACYQPTVFEITL